MNMIPRYRTTIKPCLRGLIFAQQKVYYAAAAKTEAAEKVKPFEDIPEAKGLPVIGTLLDYTPIKGFKVEYMYRLYQKRHARYGDIYKERLPAIPGNYQVVIRSKEDTEAMFRNEGPMPGRSVLEHMQQLKIQFGKTDSIINLNGLDWQRVRNSLNPLLLKMKPMWKYVNVQREVSRDFAEFVGENLDEKLEVPDFQNALLAWAFEIFGVAVLNTRLHVFSEKSYGDNIGIVRNNKKLLNFFIDFILNPALTKSEKRRRVQENHLEEAGEVYSDQMTRVKEIISSSMKNNTENKATIIEQLMANEAVTEDEKYSLVIDLLLGAIDTTSNGAALCLYSLANNPEVQDKLRKEIMDLPNDIDGRRLDAMQYMNGFIKEAARLYPLTHFFNRIYNEDQVFSGYRVPAGTSVINTSNVLNGRDPEYFSEPEKLRPERWYSTENSNDTRFNLIGSFGLGARACPGRRLAMQEIRLLLIELLPKYKLEYHYEPIESVFRLTGAPSEKPQFKFIQLKNGTTAY